MTKCCRKSDTDPNQEIKIKKLAEIIKTYTDEPGALISVLQEAQKIYGYLSEEVMVLNLILWMPRDLRLKMGVLSKYLHAGESCQGQAYRQGPARGYLYDSSLQRIPC